MGRSKDMMKIIRINLKKCNPYDDLAFDKSKQIIEFI